MRFANSESSLNRCTGLSAAQQRYLWFKYHIFDRWIAVVLILLCAPATFTISLALLLLCPKQRVIFRQTRVGCGGRRFVIFKFRTVAEAREASKFEAGLYLWLRRLSLDELPQLVNVLKGDMSLVGPRPLVPAECLPLSELYPARFMVRPGLTGLWQSQLPVVVKLTEKLELDCGYVKGLGWRLDIIILLKTFRVMLYKPLDPFLWGERSDWQNGLEASSRAQYVAPTSCVHRLNEL